MNLPFSDPNTQANSTKLLLDQAMAFHKAGQLDQAKNIYERLLDKRPHFAPALQLLGVVYSAHGKHEKAAQLMEQSLEIEPQQSNVIGNLARCYVRMEQFEKARDLLMRAKERFPNNDNLLLAEIFLAQECGDLKRVIAICEPIFKEKPSHLRVAIELGGTYFRIGDMARAEKIYRTAFEHHPRDLAISNGLGSVFQKQQKLEQAHKAFNIALEIDPNNASSHCNMGYLLYEMRRYEEAEIHLKRAIELDPNHCFSNNNYSMTLYMLGRVKEAEDYARRAVAIKPDYPNAYNNLGNALVSNGKEEEAAQAYLKCIELEPLTSHAYRNYSSVVKFKDTPEHQALIEKMKMLYAKYPDDIKVRTHLGFALGKVYSDLKQPENAFPYFEAGNQAMRQTIPYNQDLIDQFFADVKTTFTPEFVKKAPKSTNTSNRPIFILGMPRSGTTLVEQILASHPDVFGAEELNYMGYLAHPRKEPSIEKHYPLYMKNITPERLDEIAKSYLEQLAGHDEKHPRVTDKMPANFQYIGLIRQALPNAKIIHCTRDPMDTCFSIYKNYFVGSIHYSYDLQELGHYYKHYEKLMAHWHNIYPGDIFDISYEEMIETPETLIPKLLEFCELEWNDACMEFHKTKRSVRTASLSQVTQPIYKTSLSAWKPYERFLTPLKNSLCDQTS